MEDMKCPICGITFNNTRHRGSHFWNAHKIKYSEYVAQNSNNVTESIDNVATSDIAYQQALSESVRPKAAEGLFKPSAIKESTEFVNEKPAFIADRSIVQESNHRDTDFVSQVRNPYKDLYRDDEAEVLNEWLR